MLEVRVFVLQMPTFTWVAVLRTLKVWFLSLKATGNIPIGQGEKDLIARIFNLNVSQIRLMVPTNYIKVC